VREKERGQRREKNESGGGGGYFSPLTS